MMGQFASIIEIPFIETSERKDFPFSFGVVIALPVNIEAAGRSRYVPFMPIRARVKKERERERGRGKNRGANDSARRASERAGEQIFSPCSPQAVDLAGLFSLLSAVRRFHPSRPDSFPLSSSFSQTRFRRGRSVSGNTHAFPALRPTRRIVARSVHVHVRARAGGICYAFRCIEQLSARPAADILFNSIISLTVSSPQSTASPASPAPSAFDSLSVRRGIIIVDKEAIFQLPRLINDESVSKTDGPSAASKIGSVRDRFISARSKFAGTFRRWKLKSEKRG